MSLRLCLVLLWSMGLMAGVLDSHAQTLWADSSIDWNMVAGTYGPGLESNSPEFAMSSGAFQDVRPGTSSSAESINYVVESARFIGEALAGAVGGVLLGAVVNGVMITMDDSGGDSEETGYLGFCIGSVFGSSLGVYSVGSIGRPTGSFEGTMLGSIAVLGADLILMFATGSDALFYVSYACPLAGALLGFNLTRRNEPSRQRTGLVPRHNLDVPLAWHQEPGHVETGTLRQHTSREHIFPFLRTVF